MSKKLYKIIADDELFDKHKHNAYAFGTFWSAYQAKKLGYPRICVAEIGCAGGNGLLALEEVAKKVENYFDISVSVTGFDTGKGMPEPESYKDLPYVWRSQQYKMDVEALKNRLSFASLCLGDVEDTIPPFLNRLNEQKSVLGFVSFDVDYYSSTKKALEIFGESEESHNALPRCLAYFDDVTSTDIRYMCEDVGQLKAIGEFNEKNQGRKIRQIHELYLRRNNPALWNKQMYVCHNFSDPSYNIYIDWNDEKNLPLV